MNMKMKSLSLAVLGLAGFAFAGSAMAACTAANLSAWSSTSALGGTVTVATGGLETGTPSECRLDVQVGSGPGANAFVRDNTPAAEARYRAQFLINIDALGALTSIQTVKVFGATTDTPASGISDVVRLTIGANFNGSVKLLNVFSVASGAATSGTVPLAAGVNRVEIDYVKAAAGSLKVWVNNTNEALPSLTLTGDNSAWGGVDYATLGLSTASPAYRTGHAGQLVSLDKFDSRRQTFIGG